jgi:hypothetical protein
MALLHDNINANFRILLNGGIGYNLSKRIVIRLVGKVIHDLVIDGCDIKIIYSDYGVRSSVKINIAAEVA